MNCPSCTEAIPNKARFCAFCGTPVRYCPSCGRGYETSAQFCGACGTTLSAEHDRVANPGVVDPLRSEDAQWLHTDRAGVYGFIYHPSFPDNRYYMFEGDTTIGAGEKNDIVVDKPAVSWNHALIVCRNEKVLLQDSASTNGTFLNEARISRPRDVRHGDCVRFGNVEFRIWLKPQIRNQGS